MHEIWNAYLRESTPLPLPLRLPVKFLGLNSALFSSSLCQHNFTKSKWPQLRAVFPSQSPWQLHQHNSSIFHSCTGQPSHLLSSSLPWNPNCGMQHSPAEPRICSITEEFASNELSSKCCLLLTCQCFLLKFPCAPSSLGCNKTGLIGRALIPHLNTLFLFRRTDVDGKEQITSWDQT